MHDTTMVLYCTAIFITLKLIWLDSIDGSAAAMEAVNREMSSRHGSYLGEILFAILYSQAEWNCLNSSKPVPKVWETVEKTKRLSPPFKSYLYVGKQQYSSQIQAYVWLGGFFFFRQSLLDGWMLQELVPARIFGNTTHHTGDSHGVARVQCF